MGLGNVRVRRVGHPKPRPVRSPLLDPPGERPPTTGGSYTLEGAELCDRLPHKTAANRLCARSYNAADPCASLLHGPSRDRSFAPRPVRARYPAEYRDAAAPGRVFRALQIDLIEPCGFVFDDRRLSRAALDYAARATICRHNSWDAFLAERGPASRLVLLTTRGTVALHRFAFAADDTLLLGRESAGVRISCIERPSGRVAIPLAGRRALAECRGRRRDRARRGAAPDRRLLD